MEEDLGARFNHNKKKVHKRKAQKSASFNRNNSRNRDVYGIAKATGKVLDVSIDDATKYWEEMYVDNSFEDRLIEEIDRKKKEVKS